MPNDRNTIFAIALSIMVLLGWQYFIATPHLEKERAKIAATKGHENLITMQSRLDSQQLNTAPSSPDAQNNVTVPRVNISNENLSGSISLRGGYIDDVTLKKYHDSLDPHSPNISLLVPSTLHGSLVETGWLLGPGATIDLPQTNTIWKQIGDNSLTTNTPVTLSWTNLQGFNFLRTISLDTRYLFTITDEVKAPQSIPTTSLVPYGAARRFGSQKVEDFYILHEGLIGVFGKSGLREVDYSELLEKRAIEPGHATGGWIGFVDKYWAVALIPNQNTIFHPIFTASTDQSGIPRFQSYAHGTPLSLDSDRSISATINIFVGAKEVAVIRDYESALKIDRFETLIDWGWFWFITRPMFSLINFINSLLGNFGLAILAVTVLLKLAFFPLANRSYEAMSKLKKLQPAMQDIQVKYKEDRLKQQQAIVDLYKKEKINPLPGCLPILLQIPVFFSLYKVLFLAIEMRHAPFYGWIHDLSAPDPTSIFNLFGLLPYTLPAFLQVGAWPVIMGLTMFIQMKMNPAPLDKTQRFIFDIMPLVFTFMLAAFPAGLLIYWAWNNILSIIQHWYIMRKNGVNVALWTNIKEIFMSKN